MITRIFRRVLSLLFILTLNKKKVELDRNVFFLGLPILQIKKHGKLKIGKDSTINSSNKAYHLNMWSRTRFIVKQNARLSIGSDSRIHGTCIHCYKEINIGNGVLIAANTQIFDCNGHDLSFDNIENRKNTQGQIKPICIENNVWIGTGVVVLPGVTIGEGSVISANSVVSTDIPPYTLAGGNPAVVLRSYTNR